MGCCCWGSTRLQSSCREIIRVMSFLSLHFSPHSLWCPPKCHDSWPFCYMGLFRKKATHNDRFDGKMMISNHVFFLGGGGIPHSGQPHYRWWVGGSSHPWPRLWNDGTWIAVAIPKWLYKDFRLVTSYSSGTFLLWTIVIYCHLPIFLDNKHIFFKNSEAKKEGWAFFGRAARRPLGTGFLGGVSPTDVDREKYRILLISLI